MIQRFESRAQRRELLLVVCLDAQPRANRLEGHIHDYPTAHTREDRLTRAGLVTDITVMSVRVLRVVAIAALLAEPLQAATGPARVAFLDKGEVWTLTAG